MKFLEWRTKIMIPTVVDVPDADLTAVSEKIENDEVLESLREAIVQRLRSLVPPAWEARVYIEE